ncbi:V-type ATP synthase subunit D [bacterium]|nr:V-type ATP synthase subunit D [bacterium]
MRLNVNPNRMELLKLRKRLALAKRGHKLLQDKQEQLMRYFLRFVSRARELRKQVQDKVDEGLRRFELCRLVTPEKFLINALSHPAGELKLKVEVTRLLSVRIPRLELESQPNPFTYGLTHTPSDLDLSLKALSETVPLMMELVNVEKTIVILSEEIEKTRRRVNALKFVFIPNMVETVKYIKMKLDELERSNVNRLMRLKELVFEA